MIGAPIEGPRLLLRDMEAGDAFGPYQAWMNDSGATRFLESRFVSYGEAALVSYIDAMPRTPTSGFSQFSSVTHNDTSGT